MISLEVLHVYIYLYCTLYEMRVCLLYNFTNFVLHVLAQAILA